MKTEYKIFPGGMMRCCIESVHQFFEKATEDPDPGTPIDCQWCKSGAIVEADKKIVWNRDKEPRP